MVSPDVILDFEDYRAITGTDEYVSQGEGLADRVLRSLHDDAPAYCAERVNQVLASSEKDEVLGIIGYARWLLHLNGSVYFDPGLPLLRCHWERHEFFRAVAKITDDSQRRHVPSFLGEHLRLVQDKVHALFTTPAAEQAKREFYQNQQALIDEFAYRLFKKRLGIEPDDIDDGSVIEL